MSRIGKIPVAIPSGVEVKVDGHVVTVKGSKGELTREFNPMMTIKVEGEEVIVECPGRFSSGKEPSWPYAYPYPQHGRGRS